MKDNNKNKSENQEMGGTSRRGFIAKTLFAAAGSIALAASQNPGNAQTGKRKNVQTKTGADTSLG